MIRTFTLLLFASLIALAPAALQAQDSEIEKMFESVQTGQGLPTLRPALSLQSDAQAVVTNPALIGFLEDTSGGYLYSASDAFNTGHGLYVASPIFAGLALGASVEFLAPDQDILMRRYHIAAAWAYGDVISIGARYRFFGSETHIDIDEFSSLDLGLTIRWLPHVAASLVVEHANTPRLDDEWLDPILRAGLGVVLLDGRLDIDAFYTLPQLANGAGNFDVTLRGEPTGGLHLYGTAHGGDDPMRWGGGLELRQGYFALGLGAYAQTDLDTGDTLFDGFGVSFTAHAAPQRSLYRSSERWIRLALPADLAERAPRSPFGVAGSSFAELLLQLQAIADDASIDGVLIEVDGLAFGYSQLYELRTELARMREADKRIVAHLRDTSTRSYYLASVADRVYMTAAQTFDPNGLSLTLSYYGRGLKMLGVEPEFVKIDRYKTAPDAFLRESPTEFAKEQTDLYLDSLYNQLVADIAAGRNQPDAAVRQLFDNSPLTPDEALTAGFIDGIAHRDQLPQEIQAAFGLEAPPLLEEGYTAPPWDRTDWTDFDQIAIIHVDGAITRGQSVEVPILGSMSTGSKTISDMLAYAVASPAVKAIVLRVDSPGGSAFASDLMYHAIAEAAKAKPLIVSMSNIAASGGYYVAAPGHLVLATPMTLTGSIGIYTGKFNFSELFSRLGIARFIVKRGQFSDLYSASTGWTDEHRARAQASIEYLYDLFIERVASGRGLEPDAVRDVGEGHIWPGRVAQQIGLVDEIGGLLDAIEHAKSKAGIGPDAHVKFLQLPPRGPLSAFEVGIPNLVEASSSPSVISKSSQTLDLLLERIGFLPTSMIFDEGEALMLLPFDMMLD